MKYNTVFFSFSHYTADTSIVFNIKTEKDIQIYASFYLGQKNTSILKAPEYESNAAGESSGHSSEKNIGISKNGYFTFDAHISGGTETKINSNGVIREFERKD